MKLKRVKNKAKGECITCSDPALPNRAQCARCLEKCSKKFIALRQKRLSEGKCYQCKEKATIGQVCYKHWFVRIASKMGSRSAGKALQDLWERGNRLCPYTGRTLIIGQNASCDHIIPVSRGGTHDVTNIQWVDVQINRMKTDMTHDEFVQMCGLIALRWS